MNNFFFVSEWRPDSSQRTAVVTWPVARWRTRHDIQKKYQEKNVKYTENLQRVDSYLLLLLYLRNHRKTLEKKACPWALTLYLCTMTLHLARVYVHSKKYASYINLKGRTLKKSTSPISIEILNCKIYIANYRDRKDEAWPSVLAMVSFSALRAPVSALPTFAGHVVLSEPIIHL